MHLRYVNTWKIDVCNWAYKCISKLKLFQRIYAMSLFVKQVIKRGLHLHKIELIIDQMHHLHSDKKQGFIYYIINLSYFYLANPSPITCIHNYTPRHNKCHKTLYLQQKKFTDTFSNIYITKTKNLYTKVNLKFYFPCFMLFISVHITHFFLSKVYKFINKIKLMSI